MKFEIGIELLDKKTQTPIEHTEFESTDTLENAIFVYNNFNITQNETAKYLKFITDKGEKVFASFGYSNITEDDTQLVQDFIEFEDLANFLTPYIYDMTSYDTLKDFVKYHIENDNLNLALHILTELQQNIDSDFWVYDYTAGTCDTPQPLEHFYQLEQFLENLL